MIPARYAGIDGRARSMGYIYPPSVAENLVRLMATGDVVKRLERDLRMVHLNGQPLGQLDVRIAAQSQLWLFAESQLQTALYEQHRLSAWSRDGALQLIDQSYRAYPEALVWGFVGRSVSGERYDNEAEIMEGLFGSLSHFGIMPSLAVDGGLSTGVPAIAAVLAKHYEAHTLGIVSQDMLGHIGPRDGLVIASTTNHAVSASVGYAADVMVCVGGDADDLRSLEMTLSMGGMALIVHPSNASRDVLVHGLHQSPFVQEAYNEGRVIESDGVSGFSGTIERFHAAALDVARRQRSVRLQYLSSLMAG